MKITKVDAIVTDASPWVGLQVIKEQGKPFIEDPRDCPHCGHAEGAMTVRPQYHYPDCKTLEG